MKRQSDTAWMIGQIVESISEPSTSETSIRYRLDRLVSQDIANRTFLATELQSSTQFVLKIILFCPDLEAEEAALAKATVPRFFETDINLPYLRSFEVETAIGEGLVLVKPYKTSVATKNSMVTQTPVSTMVAASSQRRLSLAHSAPTHSAPTHSAPGQSSWNPSPQSRPSQTKLAQPRSPYLAAVTPHRQLTYSTFKVRPLPKKMEVQCLESSIKEGLVTANTEDSLLDSLEAWMAVVIGTVVFVGGIMVVTGSLPAALIVAAMLPILFYTLTVPEEKGDRIATLRFTSASEGRTFMDLTTMKRPTRNRLGQVNTYPENSKLHCSRLSIQTVKVSPTLIFSASKNPLMAKLSFTFHGHNQNKSCKRLSIVGTYAEIRWLSHHIAQWGRARETHSSQ